MTMQVFCKLNEAKRYAKREAKARNVGFYILETMEGALSHRMGYDYLAVSFDDSLAFEATGALKGVAIIKGE